MTENQTSWPAHLRDDAPFQQCDRCGRKTWSVKEFGGPCTMPQEYTAVEGWQAPCGGTFRRPR